MVRKRAFVAALATLAATASAGGAQAGSYTSSGFSFPMVANSTFAAAPYPVTAEVAGEAPYVADIRVRLDGLSAEIPDALDVMLVGPGGQSATLLSDIGGSDPDTAETLVIHDGGDRMPQFSPLGTVEYRPTNADGGDGDLFDPPAPAPGLGTFAPFRGGPANGSWRIYGMLDSPFAAATISQVTLTISSRQAAAVDVEAAAGSEARNARIRLRRQATMAAGLGAGSIAYTTRDGSAKAGEDYAPVSGRATFAAGEAFATVEVPIRGDSVDEDIELFSLELSEPSGDAAVGATQPVYIADNDNAPAAKIRSTTCEEGDAARVDCAIPIALTAPSQRRFAVHLRVTGGTAKPGVDFVQPLSAAQFSGGAPTANAALVTLGDKRDERDRTLVVIPSSTEAPDQFNTLLPATVVLADDDPAAAPAIRWRRPKGSPANWRALTFGVTAKPGDIVDLRVGGGRSATRPRIGSATTRIREGGRGVVNVRLSPGARRRLAAARAHGRRLTVKATARDTSGRSRPARLALKLR